MKKLNVYLAATALALVGLTGCASGGGSGDDGTGGRYGDTGDGTGDTGDTGGATGISSLATADSSLGTIVVDDAGMTVYLYDKDTQGATSSACTGQCATNWPAVEAEQAPTLDGVTGEVGLITGVDGNQQVTLDGWPLYYYVGDSAAGDTSGQGVGDIWWVLAPDGSKISG